MRLTNVSTRTIGPHSYEHTHDLQLAQQSVTAVDSCNGGRPRDGVTAVDRQGRRTLQTLQYFRANGLTQNIARLHTLSRGRGKARDRPAAVWRLAQTPKSVSRPCALGRTAARRGSVQACCL